MKSYMPGEHGWTDHGPRTYYSPPPETRPYSWTTFDRHGEGVSNASTTGLVLIERSRRTDAEEDYLDALYGLFQTALQRLTEQHRLYLRGIMEGKSTRTHGDELGISFQAVAQGRKRALDALAKALGAKGLSDRAGIRQGLIRSTNFNLTEWLPGFTEGADA